MRHAYGVLERLESGRLDERALDYVWADSELLALEFEAIVSANYPDFGRPSRTVDPPARRRSVHDEPDTDAASSRSSVAHTGARGT